VVATSRPGRPGDGDATETDRQVGPRLVETLEWIRWRVCHGQARRALDIVAETVIVVDTTVDNMSRMSAAAGRLTGLCDDPGTYVTGQPDIIIVYATARRPFRRAVWPPHILDAFRAIRGLCAVDRGE
jgi:hypothetical protein